MPSGMCPGACSTSWARGYEIGAVRSSDGVVIQFDGTDTNRSLFFARRLAPSTDSSRIVGYFGNRPSATQAAVTFTAITTGCSRIHKVSLASQEPRERGGEANRKRDR